MLKFTVEATLPDNISSLILQTVVGNNEISEYFITSEMGHRGRQARWFAMAMLHRVLDEAPGARLYEENEAAGSVSYQWSAAALLERPALLLELVVDVKRGLDLRQIITCNTATSKLDIARAMAQVVIDNTKITITSP